MSAATTAAAASAILILSITMNLAVTKAVRRKIPPNPHLMRLGGRAIRILLLIAIITAVVVFSA